MSNRTFRSLVLASVLLLGCTPKVTTIMTAAENMPVGTDRVMEELPSDSVSEPSMAADTVSVKKQRSKPKQPQGSLKIHVGPAVTTSKMYTSTRGDYDKDLQGVGFGLSLTNIGNNGIGWGIDFYGSHTSWKLSSRQSSFFKDTDASYTQFYIGPNFAVGYRFVEQLRMEVTLGLGLSAYKDVGQTEVGFGTRFAVGIEVMPWESVGFGIELFNQGNYFKKPDNLKGVIDEAYGIQQLGLLFGIRIYH